MIPQTTHTAAPYRLRLILPLSELNTSATRRNRFVQGKVTKRTREIVLLETLRCRPRAPLLKAKVTCRRHSSAKPDFENLTQGFKAAIDALQPSKTVMKKTRYGKIPHEITRAGIVIDDDDAHMAREYEWVYARPREGYLEIIVEEMPCD